MPSAMYSCGGDRLTGLTDLELSGVVTRVHSGTRSTDCSTEGIGQLFDDGELVRAADTTSTGDDNRTPR